MIDTSNLVMRCIRHLSRAAGLRVLLAALLPSLAMSEYTVMYVYRRLFPALFVLFLIVVLSSDSGSFR